jgi:hypothetical protein
MTHVSLMSYVSALCVLTAALGLSACGGDGKATSGAAAATTTLPQGSEPVELNPDDFSLEIDNPYWPMKPGDKWVYSETDTTGTKKKVVVEVTDKTKMIANGIEARVIRDTVTENGVGKAEDKAGVITVGKERVEMPFGFFDEDVPMTRDLVPTEPKVQELKFYVPGVGPVLSVHTEGAGGRGVLISFTKGG